MKEIVIVVQTTQKFLCSFAIDNHFDSTSIVLLS